jgi:hypothetical protein
MKRISLLLLLCVTTIAGCSKRVSCEDERVGRWAIQFTTETADDGTCPYTGTVTRESQEEELVCSKERDTCLCEGGSEFGVYDVVLENTATGDVDRAVIQVDAAASPICINRTAITRFERDNAGGAGGMNN